MKFSAKAQLQPLKEVVASLRQRYPDVSTLEIVEIVKQELAAYQRLIQGLSEQEIAQLQKEMEEAIESKLEEISKDET